MIRRICLFAGPCAGKSTLAAWLFAEMKMMGYEVENISEFVKAWAFIGRIPTSFDQAYILCKQMHKEDIVLRNNKSIVVTESPLFLSTCYAKHYKTPGYKQFLELVDLFEETFPSLNIFVDRKDVKYKTEGRFQDYEQAMEMDKVIKDAMDEHKLTYHTIAFNDLTKLKSIVQAHITS